MSIEATRDSRCTVCDELIFVGDSIEEVDGEWVHEKCAEEEE